MAAPLPVVAALAPFVAHAIGNAICSKGADANGDGASAPSAAPKGGRSDAGGGEAERPRGRL